MRSHTSCTSASRCEQSRTVLPCCLSERIRSFISRVPIGIQAGRRLVEQDQIGVVDQRLGQADAAGHALGILAKLSLARSSASRPTMSSSSGTRRFSSLRRDLEEPAVELQRLFAVEEAVEVRLFGQEADLLVDRRVDRRAGPARGACRASGRSGPAAA